MTLFELLVLIGEYEDEKIQISSEDDWETYDEFCVGSILLKPFYDLKIISIAAIEHNIFRVDLDLSGMEGEVKNV